MKIKDSVVVEISQKEAQNGTTKIISEGGLTHPLKLAIPKEIKDETVLRITNAEYSVDDEIVTQPLDAIVCILKSADEAEKNAQALGDDTKKTKKKKILKIALIVIALLAVAGAGIFFLIRAKNQGVENDITESVSDEKTDNSTIESEESKEED